MIWRTFEIDLRVKYPTDHQTNYKLVKIDNKRKTWCGVPEYRDILPMMRGSLFSELDAKEQNELYLLIYIGGS